MAALKLSLFRQPYWTGTWTSDLQGTFSDGRGARSYFMVSTDRWNRCAKDEPWIRKCDNGWAVVLTGTVIETRRLKVDAQRAAEDLAGLDS